MSTSSGNIVPLAPVGSCHFYIKRKRRFCRFKPCDGQTYCAEHCGLLGIEMTRKRIQCPLNGKHTCYEDKLQKHLKKCRGRQPALPIYHTEGINSGHSEATDQTELGKISDIPLEELLSFIARVRARYQEFVEDIDKEILTHDCLKQEMSNLDYGIPALRHRKQQASLIGHLEKMGMLHDGICYVEMGAGKGMLSHWIQKALKDCKETKFILVDRGSVRYKADNQHKWGEEGPKFERIRIDISDLELGRVPSIAECSSPIVAVGKHLCGCATDLALRCLTQTLNTDSTKDLDVEPQSKVQRLEDLGHQQTGLDPAVQGSKFAGLTVALCCHHRCDWMSYVGKEFMSTCEFSPRDFALLCKISGWAVATWKGWTSVDQMSSETKRLTKQTQKESDQTDISSNTPSIMSDDTNTGERSQVCEQDRSKDEKNCDNLINISSANEDSNKVSELSPSHMTDGMADSEEGDDEEHQPTGNLTRQDLKLGALERETIGRMCKRLIDYGRVCYLRKHNLRCKLTEYIEQRLTPENVAIIAFPDQQC